MVKHNQVIDAIRKNQINNYKTYVTCKGHLIIDVSNVNCHTALICGIKCKAVKINTRSNYLSI